MLICTNCRKKVRRNNVYTLFSYSVSGSSCVVYLCGKCMHNERVLDKMRNLNDWKLDQMDGKVLDLSGSSSTR